MAYAKPKKFTAWSNSRLGSYETCPLKCKLENLDKIQSPKSPAMERGSEIHTKAEQFLKGTPPRMPIELKLFSAQLTKLKAKRKKDAASVVVEDQWGFTNKWEPCAWNDWANCWLRVKLDCAERVGNTVTIIDFKTGKFRMDNLQDYTIQLELYAVAALAMYGALIPDIVVRPQLWYLDHGITYPRPMDPQLEYTMKDFPRLKKAWEARVKPMLNDTTFAPKPNKYCYACWFRKENTPNLGQQLCKY